MTTDLQRMRQDEWLSALRGSERQGTGNGALRHEPHCALGTALNLLGWDKTAAWITPLIGQLGISSQMISAIWIRNDGSRYTRMYGYCGPAMSFSDLADWFKAERDAWDGDLSGWMPAS